jgi:hypothetical protein
VLQLSCTSPTTAERIRSACVRAGGALLAIEHDDPVPTPVHHLLDDGSFALALPTDTGNTSSSGPSPDRKRCWS